jgi:hypothetical protein
MFRFQNGVRCNISKDSEYEVCCFMWYRKKPYRMTDHDANFLLRREMKLKAVGGAPEAASGQLISFLLIIAIPGTLESVFLCEEMDWWGGGGGSSGTCVLHLRENMWLCDTLKNSMWEGRVYKHKYREITYVPCIRRYPI